MACSLASYRNLKSSASLVVLWDVREMSEDKPWEGPVDGCSAPSYLLPSQYAHQSFLGLHSSDIRQS